MLKTNVSIFCLNFYRYKELLTCRLVALKSSSQTFISFNFFKYFESSGKRADFFLLAEMSEVSNGSGSKFGPRKTTVCIFPATTNQ